MLPETAFKRFFLVWKKGDLKWKSELLFVKNVEIPFLNNNYQMEKIIIAVITVVSATRPLW